MNTPFRTDRLDARWMGVCAGLSHSTGIDATLIRFATVILALCTSVMPVLLLYVLIGLIAR